VGSSKHPQLSGKRYGRPKPGKENHSAEGAGRRGKREKNKGGWPHQVRNSDRPPRAFWGGNNLIFPEKNGLAMGKGGAGGIGDFMGGGPGGGGGGGARNSHSSWARPMLKRGGRRQGHFYRGQAGAPGRLTSCEIRSLQLGTVAKEKKRMECLIAIRSFRTKRAGPARPKNFFGWGPRHGKRRGGGPPGEIFKNATKQTWE